MEAILVSHTCMSQAYLDPSPDPYTDPTTITTPPLHLLTHYSGGIEAILVSHTRMS